MESEKESRQSLQAFAKAKENRLGMVLDIRRSIIDAHRDRPWVAFSEGPGARICFTIPLPTSRAQ